MPGNGIFIAGGLMRSIRQFIDNENEKFFDQQKINACKYFVTNANSYYQSRNDLFAWMFKFH